jgi:hypothetical protein
MDYEFSHFHVLAFHKHRFRGHNRRSDRLAAFAHFLGPMDNRWSQRSWVKTPYRRIAQDCGSGRVSVGVYEVLVRTSKVFASGDEKVKQDDPKSRKTRIALARMITRLFDLWELDMEDQASMLGLPRNSGTTLEKYRNGAPLSDDRELLERVAYLLSIYKSLRLLFSQNRTLAHKWPTTPNRIFGGQSPAEVICKDGLSGLLAVKRYLDSEKDR